MFKASRVNIRWHLTINSSAIPQINTNTGFVNTVLGKYTIKCSPLFKKALKQTPERLPANLGVSRLTAGAEAKHNIHIKCFTVNTFDKTRQSPTDAGREATHFQQPWETNIEHRHELTLVLKKTRHSVRLYCRAVYVLERIQFHHVGVHSPLARTWGRHFLYSFYRSNLKYCDNETSSGV